MSSLRFIQDRSDKISDAEREARQRHDDAYFQRMLRMAWERGEFPGQAMKDAA